MAVVIIVIGGIYVLQNKPRPASGEGIKVGFVGPLSGDLANIGANARAAVEIAVEEINAAGGIYGRPIAMIYEDGGCTGSVAVHAGNKLLNVDKVRAIIGGTCSSETLAMAPLAEAAKVPVISYCSTAATITNAGDYIFRTVPSDNFQADFAAKYTYNALGKRKAAVVYINNDWGAGIQAAFRQSFTGLGGTIVMNEGYAPTSKDLRSQMAKVKASGADLLYFAGFTDGTIAGLRQAKELGITATIFGADAWDDTKIWQDLGANGDGAMFTIVSTKGGRDFERKMTEKLGDDSIIYCSNYAYDSVKILADAMRRAGVDDPEALKNALYTTVYRGGVASDRIAFDTNGDPTVANYVIKVVQNGVASKMK